MLVGESFDFPHVHPVVLAIHVVRDRVVEPARDVDFHPVGEVAAVVERQPQKGVARFEERHVGGVVGLGSGVWLDVHVLRPEELLRPVYSELLGDVYLVAAAVVPLPG